MTPEINQPKQASNSLFQTMLEGMARDIPDEEWQQLPTDGAENHDHRIRQLLFGIRLLFSPRRC